MVRFLDNWERLVWATLRREQLRADGFAGAIVPSHVRIDAILQAVEDLEDEDPIVARILCEQAYSLAQNLDPSSEGSGLLMFKTGLMSVVMLKIAKKDRGAIKRKHDIENLWKFYFAYKKRHKVDDIQKEQQRLMESGNFSTNLGEMEDRVAELKKVSATLRALIDALEELGRYSDTDGVVILIMEEVKKIKITDAALGGEFTPYDIVPLDKKDITSNPSNKASRFKMFKYMEIHDATNGFSESSKIGRGGYGSVYKGYLDNTEVAIKMLDATSTQGSEEFLQELDILEDIYHPNLVKLVGACFKHRALIYEFVPNGSVEDCLKERPEVLTWQLRTRIIFELCSTLIFLHSQKPRPLVHGDLKPHNILMDANFSVKLSDFGLCRFLPEGSSSATVAFHVTKNIKGTEWYMDPDFLESGKITPGCDVYAFGVTMLRILTRAPAARILGKVEVACIKKELMTIVDHTAGDWPAEVAEYLACMGLECCDPKRKCSRLMQEISIGLEDILAKNST